MPDLPLVSQDRRGTDRRLEVEEYRSEQLEAWSND
jgi:hypothetical protein